MLVESISRLTLASVALRYQRRERHWDEALCVVTSFGLSQKIRPESFTDNAQWNSSVCRSNRYLHTYHHTILFLHSVCQKSTYLTFLHQQQMMPKWIKLILLPVKLIFILLEPYDHPQFLWFSPAVSNFSIFFSTLHYWKIRSSESTLKIHPCLVMHISLSTGLHLLTLPVLTYCILQTCPNVFLFHTEQQQKNLPALANIWVSSSVRMCVISIESCVKWLCRVTGIYQLWPSGTWWWVWHTR